LSPRAAAAQRDGRPRASAAARRFDRLAATSNRSPELQEVPDVGYNFGVGRAAPIFALKAHDGSEIDLRQYRGDWFPVLVFFSRLAPGASRRLSALSQEAATLWGLRAQLLGVTTGDAAELRSFADAVSGLSFPLLADDGTVAASFGAGRAVVGDAPPMVVVVDRAGKVVWMGEGEDDLDPKVVVAALRSVVR
jgi:peroxiredoxin